MRESKIKKQSPEKRFLRFVYAGLCTLYTSGLVYIFFFARRRWFIPSKRSIHLFPFRDKIEYLQTYGSHTRLENIDFYKDFIGNILLFIPFPFLLLYVFGRKSYPKFLLISAGSSLIVEAIQYILNIGVADIDDLILNTTGAALGLLLLYFVSLKNKYDLYSYRELVPGKLTYGANSK